MNKRRRLPPPPGGKLSNEPVVTGVGWYADASEFQRARELFPDGDELHDPYAEYARSVAEMIHSMEEQGIQVERVPVRVDEVLRWAERNVRLPDSSARSEYVLLQLQLRTATRSRRE
ncbi:MAG TPA: hypothetical protein VFS20_25515 [Longimicrobium sp.]|nr:hypothetical protein [Longimicrobium sp.]